MSMSVYQQCGFHMARILSPKKSKLFYMHCENNFSFCSNLASFIQYVASNNKTSAPPGTGDTSPALSGPQRQLSWQLSSPLDGTFALHPCHRTPSPGSTLCGSGHTPRPQDSLCSCQSVNAWAAPSPLSEG